MLQREDPSTAVDDTKAVAVDNTNGFGDTTADVEEARAVPLLVISNPLGMIYCSHFSFLKFILITDARGFQHLIIIDKITNFCIISDFSNKIV